MYSYLNFSMYSYMISKKYSLMIVPVLEGLVSKLPRPRQNSSKNKDQKSFPSNGWEKRPKFLKDSLVHTRKGQEKGKNPTPRTRPSLFLDFLLDFWPLNDLPSAYKLPKSTGHAKYVMEGNQAHQNRTLGSDLIWLNVGIVLFWYSKGWIRPARPDFFMRNRLRTFRWFT